MELRNEEVQLLAKTVDHAANEAMLELNELQLALVGGGIGDVILA